MHIKGVKFSYFYIIAKAIKATRRTLSRAYFKICFLTFWGHIVESAMGASLISQFLVNRFEVFCCRERNEEVDFVRYLNESLGLYSTAPFSCRVRVLFVVAYGRFFVR